MAPGRPHYPPPLNLRADSTDSDHEQDLANVPLPRTTSSAHSNPSVGPVGSGSVASRARTQHSHVPRSSSVYSSTFTVPSVSSAPAHSVSHPQQTSSTHAGGILPSASFFHPSRPIPYSDFTSSNYNPNNSAFNAVPLSSIPRPTALAHGDQRPESIGSDSFTHGSFTTDEHGLGGGGRKRAASATNPNNVVGMSSLSRTFSTKVSREPLLPIGQKPKPPIPAQLNMGRSASGRKLPGIGGRGRWNEGSGGVLKVSDGGSSVAAGGRVRTSVERFLWRTLSGDVETADEYPTKDLELSENVEDLESGYRVSEEPNVELKSTSRGTFDGSGTMNISHSANVPSALPQQKSVLRPRFPNFNPVPPSTDHPSSRTPVLNSSGKTMRKYSLHPSQNTFFLKGRILTGGDSVWPFVCSVILLLGITGTWSGTTAVWWWKNESPAVAIVGGYMCLLTLANMMATAFSDPGILPRNLDPDPPYPDTSSGDEGVRVPFPRDLKVRSGVVRVKYCQTCRIYRPPRSSHCRMCDNCVDGCDHHCQWVNNCVGRRNYTSFILLLTSATLTLCLIICTSALHLVIQAHNEHLNVQQSLRRGAGSAVVFLLSAIMIWPVGGLLGYHMRLLLLNLTTIEQIRNSAHKSLVDGPAPPNPFALGNWRHNLAEMLCRAQGTSWLSAAECAVEDRREPNPGAEIGGDEGGTDGTG
ncbi:hypothetical protein M0805_003040 [Coniferiporia weirii]|nr:hypothetical protein M0805_003040 [Coniferiporia weirii]